MLGGGEYAFLDLVTHLPREWRVLAVAPYEGDLSSILFKKRSTPESFLFLPFDLGL